MDSADSPTVAHKDLRSRLSEQLAQKQAGESSDMQLEPPTSARIGTLLGDRYRLNSLLGVGGMGSVYLARDLELDDDVALKLLRRDVIDIPGALDRFRREVKLARRVTHPNVSRTYDIASNADDHYITMEPLAGDTLARVMKGEPLDDRTIAQIGLQICAGLNAAHRAGVVHRDLKPQNVMLEPQEGEPERIVIMDFGIAQSSRVESEGESGVGQVVGTPAYMAPEQLSGLAVDRRADLCSLGIVLFELFTGVLPWHGSTPSSTALARLRRDAPDPRDFRTDLPAELAKLTLQCLARSPESRPDSAANVAQELKGWLHSNQGHPSKPLIWLPRKRSEEGATLTSHRLSEVNAALEPHSADLGEEETGPRPSAAAVSLTKSSQLESSSAGAGVRVAVVPHTHEGTTGASCKLLDELCAEVEDQLSRARGVRVRSLGTVRSLQRENPSWNAEQLGQALGVEFVVVVSAVPVDGECVLRTRILDVSEDVQLWADRIQAGQAEGIEACERAARAAVEALTARAIEAPEFNTWIDPFVEAVAMTPAAPTKPEPSRESESLPQGNMESSEHPTSGGTQSESRTRKPGKVCASG